MEVTQTHQMVSVVEQTQPSAARFLARRLADSLGFGEADSYRAGLVATELATNLVKHARGGELLARAMGSEPDASLELLAVDSGPGIRDVARALTDGHSTAGSPGEGLGAIRRLSDTFDLHSTEGRGTVVLARVSPRNHRPGTTEAMEVAGVSVAKVGEDVSGDAWCVRERSDRVCIAVVDGLGHGLHASEAASAALKAFDGAAGSGPARTLETMHGAARHTRGAAASIAEIRPDRDTVFCAGVGNIATSVVVPGGPLRHAVSLPGTLGHQARAFREYPYPWTTGSILVMHSDGLSSHWTFDGLDGLLSRHPAVIAAVLYREFNRHRDDVTVVVARMRP